jgi:hypothetical protein
MAAGPKAPAPPRPKPVDYICNICGGNKVTRDAWAEWDAAAQDWTLGAVYDYAFCHDCEAETKLAEIDLETPER